ncbi:hypothetical protein FACS18945_2730 [Bacteroidia bacterium]|nr:hypothetical protein FACS18945_2730 [Bacteroidia bacterium]
MKITYQLERVKSLSRIFYDFITIVTVGEYGNSRIPDSDIRKFVVRKTLCGNSDIKSVIRMVKERVDDPEAYGKQCMEYR